LISLGLKKLVDDWLLANIIEPLRSGDTKVQIQKATLRKLEAEADMKELELRELSGELINVAEIEKLLSQYFHSIRQVLRSIPASSYVNYSNQ
jgi:phage terminase Nu1 subunit (DNA packaging protein)